MLVRQTLWSLLPPYIFLSGRVSFRLFTNCFLPLYILWESWKSSELSNISRTQSQYTNRYPETAQLQSQHVTCGLYTIHICIVHATIIRLGEIRILVVGLLYQRPPQPVASNPRCNTRITQIRPPSSCPRLVPRASPWILRCQKTLPMACDVKMFPRLPYYFHDSVLPVYGHFYTIRLLVLAFCNK